MRKSIALFLAIVGFSSVAFAAAINYTTRSGDTLQSVATANHTTVAAIVAANPSIKLQRGQTLVVGNTIPTPPPSPSPTPTPTPSPSPTPTPGEIKFSAYTTGYSWYDNTPNGSPEISDPVIHQVAGGTGTYADPITIAVGHSIIGGKDILDYAKGTKFYIPNLRRYFIVEDTCGDGPTPQNGPCHTGYQGHVWIDAYVGKGGSTRTASDNCMDAITEVHAVIQNPASTYPVVAGELSSNCAQYGDTI